MLVFSLRTARWKPGPPYHLRDVAFVGWIEHFGQARDVALRQGYLLFVRANRASRVGQGKQHWLFWIEPGTHKVFSTGYHWSNHEQTFVHGRSPAAGTEMVWGPADGRLRRW